MSTPDCSRSRWIAYRAALALRESKIVSTISRSTPPRISAAAAVGVRVGKFVEGDLAHARIVDVGGDRGRAVGWTQRTCHEPRHPGVLGDLVRRFARQPRGGEVDLVHQRFQPVVALGGSGGVEGVGCDDVGTGDQKLAMDLGYALGLGDAQQIVVALEIPRPAGKPLAPKNQLRKAPAPARWYPTRRPESRFAGAAAPATARCARSRRVFRAGAAGPQAERVTDGVGEFRAVKGIEVKLPDTVPVQLVDLLDGHARGDHAAGLRIFVQPREPFHGGELAR